MGLSNEERISGIYYAINNMVEIADDIRREKEAFNFPKKLMGLVDQLWHAFLGGTRNSAHWILGSSATNRVTWGSASPWGIAAINHHTDKLLEEENILDQMEKDKPFDAFEGFLDISGLLNQVNKIYGVIYDLYSWSEQVVYYLRRYEDEFLSRYTDLSKVISDIQGECFHLFKDSDVYSRAYILNNICKFLYGKFYPYREEEWDSFTKFLSKNCGHHDLSRMMREGNLKTLAEIHIKLHKADRIKKLTIMDKAEAFLILTGRRFHYDHKFVEMMKILKLDSKKAKKLKDLFLKCKEAHDQEEKNSTKSYKMSQYSPLSIYGLSVEITEKTGEE